MLVAGALTGLLVACSGSTSLDGGDGSKKNTQAPQLVNYGLLSTAVGEATFGWSLDKPGESRIRLYDGSGNLLKENPPTEVAPLQYTSKFTSLTSNVTYHAVIEVLFEGGVVDSSGDLLFSVPGNPKNDTPVPVVLNSGILVEPSGTFGKDFVVEPRWYDRKYDDRCVVYLKSSSKITLKTDTTNNADPLGGDAGSKGVIYYKIDRDEQGGIPYVNGAQGKAYGGAIDLTTETYEAGVKVLGTFGHNNGAYGTTPDQTGSRYWRGQKDASGDEWHALTIWHDDVGWFTGGGNDKPRNSDGLYIPVVVDPKTPVIRVEAPAGEEYYTSPAKVYHIPVIHERKTWLTGGTWIHLYNLTNNDTIQYRVDGGTWTDYKDPIRASEILHTRNQAYTFECRNGTTGAIRKRVLHLHPDYPSNGEGHPRNLWWRNSDEMKAVLKRCSSSGPSLWRGGFNYFLTSTFFNGMDEDFVNIRRPGWRAYQSQAVIAGRCAFVAAVEGTETRFNGGKRFIDQAKDILLKFASVDPVGMENTLWWCAPCNERVILGQEQVQFMNIAFAYTTLVSKYRVADGNKQGVTEIMDIKMRENLADIAFHQLHYANNITMSDGEGDKHWGLGMEMCSAVFAAAIPSYDTPWFGTSGADGTKNTHAWAPFPNHKYSWWEYVTNKGIATTSHPDLAHQARVFTIYSGGSWKGAKGYDPSFFDWTPAFANIMKNQIPAAQYPFANVDLYLQTQVNSSHPQPMCVNDKFSFASAAKGTVSGYGAKDMFWISKLAFYDDTIK
ncbi:MAG: hypothetical protein R3F30_02835 [Planctomycetota bacterium]